MFQWLSSFISGMLNYLGLGCVAWEPLVPQAAFSA